MHTKFQVRYHPDTFEGQRALNRLQNNLLPCEWTNMGLGKISAMEGFIYFCVKQSMPPERNQMLR